MRALPCVIGIAMVASAVAHADPATPSYIPPTSHDVVVEVPGDRTTTNIEVIGGLALVGVGLGALGLHYNLDARDESNAVSQNMPTGRVWSSGFQADVDNAHGDSTRAIVFYSIGGAAVVAAAIAYIATEPPSRRTVMHVGFVPTQRGAVAGAVWSW